MWGEGGWRGQGDSCLRRAVVFGTVMVVVLARAGVGVGVGVGVYTFTDHVKMTILKFTDLGVPVVSW